MKWRIYSSRTSRAPSARRRTLGWGLERLEPRLLLFVTPAGRWADTQVSVSMLPDGAPTEGHVSSLYANLDNVAPRQVWQREFARALQTWATVSSLNFHFVADDGSPTGAIGAAQGDSRFGDIRLGMHPLSNGYLGYAYYPSGTTKGGDIFLDPNVGFQVGKPVDLYSILLHEAGHALGLGHSSAGTVMFGTINGVYTGLSADDIAGIRSLYGERRPDSFDQAARNETLATATEWKSVKLGMNSVTADLTDLSDVDVYRLRIPPKSNGTAAVTVDARALSLLAPKVSLFNSSGQLIRAHEGQYGQSASAIATGLEGGETLYVVVDGSGTDALSMGAYALNVQFVELDAADPPPPEPVPPPPTDPVAADRYDNAAAGNHSAKSATYLGTSGSVSRTGLTLHSQTDADFFRFRPAVSGTYSAHAMTRADAAYIDVTLMDNGLRNLAIGAPRSGGGETVVATLVAGQDYYLRISSDTGSPVAYDLIVGKLDQANPKIGTALAAPDQGHGSFGPGGIHDDGRDEHAQESPASVASAPSEAAPSGSRGIVPPTERSTIVASLDDNSSVHPTPDAPWAALAAAWQRTVGLLSNHEQARDKLFFRLGQDFRIAEALSGRKSGRRL